MLRCAITESEPNSCAAKRVSFGVCIMIRGARFEDPVMCFLRSTEAVPSS